MAKQVITRLIDDLTGGEADSTIAFSFDGLAYTIDLSEKNAEKLREALAPYRDAATRIGRAPSASSSARPAHHIPKPNSPQNRELNSKIREWAGKNGYEIADRGRIPQNVVDAFHSGTPHPDQVAADKAAAVEAESQPPARRTRAKKAPTAAFSSRKG